MKKLCLLLFLTFVALPDANAQTQPNDLSIFLGKLQTYMATHPRHIKPNMPVAKPEPENPPAPMPSLDVSGYMEDTKTGLRYYAAYDKVVDPETKYSFHIGTMQIALEPIKEKDTAYLRH